MALLAKVAPARLLAAESPGEAVFSVRAFQYSSMGLWQWKSIDQALEAMGRLGLNTLILHQSDLPDYLVWPKAYFSADFMAARNPTRGTVTNNGRNFIREVVRRAEKARVRVFLSSNEIGYPYGLVELHPELLEDGGVVCPTHPFWWEFEKAKFAEIIAEIPGLAGLVITAGGRDSKVSYAARRCSCDRCRSYNPTTWYSNLFRSIREPLAAAGQRLVVRDSAGTKREQDFVVDACSRVSPDIVVSLTNAPGDFYQGFPDNPRIGRTGRNPQWVEFDTMGQYSGMGVFPCSFVEDMQRRLGHAAKNGAIGASFRADLETVTDASAFNTPNMLNLIAGGMLAERVGRPVDEVYDAWFSYGLYDPLTTDSEQPHPVPVARGDRERLREFMRNSKVILEKTLYVRGLALADGTGQFPDSVDHAFDNMRVIHQRDDWDAGASGLIDPSPENLSAVQAEKEQAEREARELPTALDLGQTSLPEGLRASLAAMLDLYARYVEGFACCTAACFATRRALDTRGAADIEAALRTADRLTHYREETARRLSNGVLPHYVHRMLDLGCIDRLAADVRAKVASIPAAASAAPGRA